VCVCVLVCCSLVAPDQESLLSERMPSSNMYLYASPDANLSDCSVISMCNRNF
jgi:hypothetical protein